jgi:hypothetical protein
VAYTGNLSERVVHRMFHRERVRREWFRVSPRLLDALSLWDFVAVEELRQLRALVGS